MNLENGIQTLKRQGCALIIAVDACLGRPETIGFIEIGAGPIYPGAGVKKKLPPVGQAYLSGIVNLGGFMEQLVLQSTRLFAVIALAEVIACGLHRFLLPENGPKTARDSALMDSLIQIGKTVKAERQPLPTATL